MKHLIKYLLLISVAAVLLGGAYFLWDYRQHYGDWGQSKDISQLLAEYNIVPIDDAASIKVNAPVLPDLSPYTAQAVIDKIPALKHGLVQVRNLEEGYRKMRNMLPYFGEKQDRLDPLSIVVSDGVYDLDSLIEEVADDTLITKRDDGVYILYVPLSIRSDATLIVKDNQKLLLSVNTGGLISNFGYFYIVNATVKGWNTEADMPATYKDPESFRPHITSWCGSHLDIIGSTLAHLGYEASKSYGITYTSCTDTLYRDDYSHLAGATGWILDSKFYDIYFGFYSYEAEGIVIANNVYEDNIIYAIDPHDRSKNLIIANNIARRSKHKHGIIISREVSDSFIFNNVCEENNGSGIMIDRNSQNNVIAHNISQENGQDGLTFYESPNNISYKNMLVHNKNSGIRIRNSWNIRSVEEVVNYNKNSAVQLYSLYLTPARGATYRDLDLDPYVQKVGADFIRPEIVGNGESNFNLLAFDYIRIVFPQYYKSPRNIFAGEFKGTDQYFEGELFANKAGMEIHSKKEKNQNLIRSSDDPR